MAVRFNPKVHTISYLLANPAEAVDLCQRSKAFVVSDVANSSEFLSFVDLDVVRNASEAPMAFHLLAGLFQDLKHAGVIERLKTLINNAEICSLSNRHGSTVAGKFADYLTSARVNRNAFYDDLITGPAAHAAFLAKYQEISSSVQVSLFESIPDSFRVKMLGSDDYLLHVFVKEGSDFFRNETFSSLDHIERWAASVRLYSSDLGRKIMKMTGILHNRSLLVFAGESAEALKTVNTYGRPLLPIAKHSTMLVELLNEGISIPEVLLLKGVELSDRLNSGPWGESEKCGHRLIKFVMDTAPNVIGMNVGAESAMDTETALLLAVHYDNLAHVVSDEQAYAAFILQSGFTFKEVSQRLAEVEQTLTDLYLSGSDDIQAAFKARAKAQPYSSLTLLTNKLDAKYLIDLIAEERETLEGDSPAPHTQSFY